ncbi:4-hydroxybenzoate 3-monooxygenase [Candidatus Solirubrobacter pratensis]|uniref:4-hydroxybenzoate 3-monooxygenase n=1 Tax=Candidatus Solirubrobacter pratensis TaxID=1298857 RepID=UPI0004043365|nr:4-hydroxybenzoate 3-monooxygenase [Candidatus Solirubrobacter pratensis]
MASEERTQVGIVGAGPAGLVLGRLLELAGIDTVILEARSRDYVEHRIRAGVLEHDTAELLAEAGVGERMRAEGLVHDGIELRFGGAGHRIDFPKLTGGRHVVLYGQTELVKDLIAARLDTGAPLRFEATDVALHDIEGEPWIAYVHEGAERILRCDAIAGCDGFHGVSRPAVPGLKVWEREYPFGWLGILADVPPSTDELIYAHSERGFALHSMRSLQLSRLYVQCDPTDDIANWSDARIWEELHQRLALDGWSLQEGPILDKGITPMRSFVAEPMRHGRLLLAGDAAHIVPPTGAKGLNLAVADVRLLAEALIARFTGGGEALLDAYSDSALQRVWRAEHFSWWMTSMLHRFPERDAFGERLQLSQLDYTCRSEAASTSLAENYVGLATDWWSRA